MTLTPAASMTHVPPNTVAHNWEVRRKDIEQLPIPSNIAELVDNSAREFGDRQAWNFFENGETLTFTEVAVLSRKTAAALTSVGARKGTRVALMLPNGATFLGTWLGLARIGAVAVPINDRYTAREVQHVLTKSEADVLIIDSLNLETFNAIPDTERHVGPGNVFVSGQGAASNPQHWESIVASSRLEDCPSTTVGWEDTVSIQFTSGTTGFPKGCILPQRYWLNAAVSVTHTNDLEIDRFLCNQRLFYLDGQFNAMVCLYRGTTFYCSAKPSAAKFFGWVKDYKINEVFYFDPLFKAPPSENDANNELKLLHIFGFNPGRHADLENRYAAPARESFGMSELAPALIMPLDAGAMVGSGSCGLPAPHTELRIVSDAGEPVELGQPGELLIKSQGMMTGYVGEPEATQETLEDGWLHTGDLFKQDTNGFFYLVGRKKDMVRRNSENVACIEVESVLRLHPQITEAAVVAVPDSDVGEEIKAYLLPDGSELPDPEDIRAFCAIHLAKFKIPRFITFVDAFSLTESSRVEKKKLTNGKSDLRAGSYDAQTKEWIPE